YCTSASIRSASMPLLPTRRTGSPRSPSATTTSGPRCRVHSTSTLPRYTPPIATGACRWRPSRGSRRRRAAPGSRTRAGGAARARTSPTNYGFNHIGNFAAAGELTARSLFFGGVPMRFAQLRFAFLEGGAGWACSLLGDLLGHWEKRNRDAIGQYDPAALDRG